MSGVNELSPHLSLFHGWQWAKDQRSSKAARSIKVIYDLEAVVSQWGKSTTASTKLWVSNFPSHLWRFSFNARRNCAEGGRPIAIFGMRHCLCSSVVCASQSKQGSYRIFPDFHVSIATIYINCSNISVEFRTLFWFQVSQIITFIYGFVRFSLCFNRRWEAFQKGRTWTLLCKRCRIRERLTDAAVAVTILGATIGLWTGYRSSLPPMIKDIPPAGILPGRHFNFSLSQA